METCTRNGVSVIAMSCFLFLLLSAILGSISPYLFKSVAVLNPRKRAIWTNTAVSYAHANLCAIGATLCFILYPEMIQDMLTAKCELCEFTVAVSVGYFLADTLDFIIKGIYLNDPGIWIHHILVISTFGATVVHCDYAAYITATLLVEYSGIFLHQRRLWLTAGQSKHTRFFRWNSTALLLSMLTTRLAWHLYLTRAVWLDRARFENTTHWVYALSGMCGMNLINCKLCADLVRLDWDAVVRGRARLRVCKGE